MNKNELIEAINATIIPNGQKGITAESLANILLEMVNATPEEGSSSGSGVVTFYVDVTGGELSSKYKSKNAEAYNAYKHGTLASVVAIMNGEPVSTITPISISQNDDNIMLGALQGSNDGLSSMVIIINSNGSATLP